MKLTKLTDLGESPSNKTPSPELVPAHSLLPLSAFATCLALSLAAMQASARSAQQLAQAIKLAALGGAGVYGVSHSIFNVEGGHRAIIFNRLVGIKDTVYTEGTHLMVPWLERPIIYDVRAQPNTVQGTAGSRDLQMVRAALATLASMSLRAVRKRHFLRVGVTSCHR